MSVYQMLKLFLEKILQFNETVLFCIFLTVETVGYGISALIVENSTEPAQLLDQRRNYRDKHCGSYYRVSSFIITS